MSGLTNDELAARLTEAVVLPVLRAPSAEVALDQVERCLASGLDVVELTATTPGWSGALREARVAWPDVTLGLGTVLDPVDADTAVAAGADFVVSPCPVPAVRLHLGGIVPLIEGGLTPGELLGAAGRGVAKLFPAHVGGPQLLRSVLALRPSARIVPTGGIAMADVADWLSAGALAVGIGSALFEEPDLTTRLRSARRLR
ncbi:MAG: bifunctional 4-hydroxy-2-oxoglutarate aldolase/2-dehydro-3-deoxy-phosphogluconate aldolase [Actinomycetota bacterium]